jgi:N-acetylglucosaminyldiphosphoundecaprenol N-acetyl-beta-D-mannosaminyltransferase
LKKLKILCTNISILKSYEKTYENLKKVLISPSYVTVNNVHTVVLAVKDRNYREALNNSILSLPDGKPLSIVARLKGVKNIRRIFGPTFMENALEWGQEDGLKHFFFGSSEETLKKMINNIKIRYPRALVSGIYSPPYRESFSDEENEFFLKLMNDSGADIFWIGLGAPKQELWMHNNYKKLNHGVMIGIGAGFDYLAGRTKHAPEWMKNLALEWLYRLIQEPGRLWKRYLFTNSLFILYIFLDLTGIKRFD